MSTPAQDRQSKRLTFAEKFRPSKSLSKGDLRPALEVAYVIERDGKRELFTTDSYMAAFHPLKVDVPVGPIHREALERIERGEDHRFEDDGSVSFPTGGGVTVTYSKPATHTGGEDIAKRCLDHAAKADQAERVIAVGINPRLLRRLAKSLGVRRHQGVVLEIPVEKTGTVALVGMRVRPARRPHPDDPHGLLMPVRVPDEYLPPEPKSAAKKKPAAKKKAAAKRKAKA